MKNVEIRMVWQIREVTVASLVAFTALVTFVGGIVIWIMMAIFSSDDFPWNVVVAGIAAIFVAIAGFKVDASNPMQKLKATMQGIAIGAVLFIVIASVIAAVTAVD